jgi:uncharacterized protein (DUF885 family)
VGAERYRLFVRFHNGTDLDLAETYAWGWEELRTIESRMSHWSSGSIRALHATSASNELRTTRSVHGRGSRQLPRWSQEP